MMNLMKPRASRGAVVSIGRGSAAVAGLIVLGRELCIAWSGNELLYVWGLAAWLAAAALGAVRRSRRFAVGPHAATLLLAAALPSGLVLARSLRPMLLAVPGAEPGLWSLLLSSALVVGPAGWTCGLLLRATCEKPPPAAGGGLREPARQGLALVIGGVLAGFLPVAGIAGLAGVLLASFALLVSTLVSRPPAPWTAPRRGAEPAIAVLAVATAFAIAFSGRLDRTLTGWSHPSLESSRETPRGRLVATAGEMPGRPDVYRDNALLYRAAATQSDDIVVLAVSQHPGAASAAVLGGHSWRHADQLAALGVARIASLEPRDRVLRLAGDERSHLPHDLIVADPRAWLKATPDRFDLILCALPEPLTVQSNRFWTAQFAGLCAARLHDGGLLALQMNTGENVWTLPQARRLAAVQRALDGVFAEVRVLPGAITVLLAANRPLAADPEALAADLSRLDPAPRRHAVDALRRRWYDHRTAEAAAILAAAAVPPNTDLRPTCLADVLLHDLGRLWPGLGWREAQAPRTWLTPLIVGGMLLALALRRRREEPLLLVAGYVGLARGITISALLLYHQTQHGTLYRDIGFLLALVGLGQASGAWLRSLRVPWRRGPRTVSDPAFGRWRLPVLLVLLSFWTFLVSLRLLLGSGPAALGGWLLGTGLLAMLALAACAARSRVEPQRLLAADLAGGAGGTLLAALLLLPFNGLAATALTVTVLAFPAALSVWPLPGAGTDS